MPVLLAAGALVLLGCGCTKTEEKLGRGLRNTLEITRFGEINRSVEQTALFESPESAYTTGVIRGLKRTLVRTGVGIYEIVTCPFPPYDPVLTNVISADPVYPASYRPGFRDDPVMNVDAHLGFSGGDVAPMVPGSRFRVFDN